MDSLQFQLPVLEFRNPGTSERRKTLSFPFFFLSFPRRRESYKIRKLQYSSHKQGFTLIELAVVLVVIGLLMGGVLVGRGIIMTARIVDYMRKFSQYEVAIVNFKSIYGTVPGDSNLFTPPGDANGRHNSILGGTPISCHPTVTDAHHSEASHAWAHLSQAELLEGNFTYSSYIGCGGSYESINPPHPEVAPALKEGRGSEKVGSDTYNFYYTVAYYAVTGALNFPDSKIYSHYFFFTLPLEETRALDKKVDDGGFITGDMKASNNPALGWNACVPWPGVKYCVIWWGDPFQLP